MSPETEPDHTATQEAENGLLSCIMQYPDLLADARRKLPTGKAFADANNGEIYDFMIEHVDASEPLELVTFTDRLRRRGRLDQIGGPGRISDIFVYVPLASHFEFYLDIVWTRSKLTRLRQTALQIANSVDAYGREQDESLSEIVNRAETQMFELVQEVSSEQQAGTGMITTQESLGQWVDHLEIVMANRGKIIGLTTGLHEIDQTLHGLDDSQGEIFVIAGRPGQGKTAMGISLESHFIDQGFPGLTISAEMSGVQWNNRLVLGSCQIDTAKAITGNFMRGETEQIMRRVKQLQGAKRHINSDSYITTADLRSQAQIAKRQHNIRWMIIDHLTLIKPVSVQGAKEERLGIKETMEACQWIKKELNIVVVLLVQMSRESDRNIGKPPVMADLAGSAAIEQYADHIMFLYRPSYYVPWHRLSDSAREAWIDQTRPRRQRSPELWVGNGKYSDEDGGVARHDYEQDAILFFRKNRRGPTPEVHVRFVPEHTWFSTRMPCLNSVNPLDQQFGSYTAAKAVPKEADITQRKPRKPRADHDDGDDDDFYRP
jgi:replicative DNA helicase